MFFFPRHDVLRCASNDKLTATRFFPSRDVTVSSKGRKTSNNPVIYISPPFIAAHSNEQFTAEKKNLRLSLLDLLFFCHSCDSTL